MVFVICLLLVLGIGGAILYIKFKTTGMENIKQNRIENGPYGDSKFLSDEEVEKEDDIHFITYEPERWRNDPSSRPKDPGLLLGDWHEKPGQNPLAREIEKAMFKKPRAPKPVNKKGRVKYWGSDGQFHGGVVKTRLCTNDVHALMVASSGAGKTAYFLNPQIEYALATGISIVVTDTKGDIDRNYGRIAREKYGYNTVLLNLRNPMQSSRFNFLHMVSKYTRMYKEELKKNGESELAIAYQARRETYAKICSKTIITSGSDGDYGANAFFYDSAEGLLTACILLVCEYARPEEQHIISVYKLIQALSGTSVQQNGSKESEIQKILDMLPADSKIRMLAGASAQSGGESQASVVSTALSRLISFLDTETEQILCFESELDAEDFVSRKTLMILTMPEEVNTRYFLVSLVIQELYRELLTIADMHGGKVPATEGFRGSNPRVMFFLDEFGTLPKIESAEMMFSASRSRNIFFVPIVQGTVQLDRNYGKEGAAIIRDNCQIQLYPGISPQSDDAEIISKRLGTYTARNVSLSSSGTEKLSKNSTESVVSVNLMTPEEVCTMPQGDFIVMRTGKHPMKVHFDIFLDWGIPKFEPDRSKRPIRNGTVCYASREEIESNIQKERVAAEMQNDPLTDVFRKVISSHGSQAVDTQDEMLPLFSPGR